MRDQITLPFTSDVTDSHFFYPTQSTQSTSNYTPDSSFYQATSTPLPLKKLKRGKANVQSLSQLHAHISRRPSMIIPKLESQSVHSPLLPPPTRSFSSSPYALHPSQYPSPHQPHTPSYQINNRWQQSVKSPRRGFASDGRGTPSSPFSPTSQHTHSPSLSPMISSYTLQDRLEAKRVREENISNTQVSMDFGFSFDTAFDASPKQDGPTLNRYDSTPSRAQQTLHEHGEELPIDRALRETVYLDASLDAFTVDCDYQAFLDQYEF